MQTNFSVTESRNNPKEAFRILLGTSYRSLASEFFVKWLSRAPETTTKSDDASRKGMQIKSVNLFAGKSLISLIALQQAVYEGYDEKMELPCDR